MNNFDLVLKAIRQQCKDANVPDKQCIEIVKAELKSKNDDSVDFYLDFLQDLGLIKYNGSNGLIVLTERGKYTEQLFK